MSLTFFRRTTQIIFIIIVFIIPVFDIFRYDTATSELIVFGRTWSLGLKEAFYADHSLGGSFHIAMRFFLRAVLPWVVVLSVFPLLGFFTGRFFCGWLCPEGTFFELADYLTLNILRRRNLFSRRTNDPDRGSGNRFVYIFMAFLSIVLLPLLGGITLTGYLVAPKTIWTQILSLNFTPGVLAGIIGVSIYMLITSIFVRHVICKYVCAAGLMQMLFGWVSPVSMRLHMDVARAGECTNCKGCDTACFMNIAPRKNKRDISCVNCGACIEACKKELGKEGGLFFYGFGERNNNRETRCNK